MVILYIIGGFGTDAGLDVLQKVIEYWKKVHKIEGDYDYPMIMFQSMPVGYDHCTVNDCKDAFALSIDNVNAFAKLHIKHKILVLFCCNTIHTLFDSEFSIASNIDILSMPDIVTKHVNSISEKNKIYMLSTRTTYDSGIYKLNLEQLVKESEDKVKCIIQTIKQNQKVDKKVLIELFSNIEIGSIVILGCTELPLVKAQINDVTNNSYEIIDCNQVCAEYIVNYTKNLLIAS